VELKPLEEEMMARITVLGGCGAVGSVAVKTLARQPCFDEVVIADLAFERAAALMKKLRSKKLSAVRVNALDQRSVKAAVQGSAVVLNCVGPFYQFVKPILSATLASGINYVDICDDVDVTLEILKLNDQAKRAGVTALIGMGSSPGATNLLAKLAADHLLDEVEAIDIFHAHGGEPFEGEGVIAHRFHCMSIPIPMFLDGRLKHVNYFEPEGIALREEFEFPVLGKVLLYPYPHPEQVTLPRHIKCRRVTNKGAVLPEPYYNLIRDLCGRGLADKEPIEVKGMKIAPRDFAAAFIIRERERILKRTRFGAQRGCATVIVKGTKDGKPRQYRFHMASRSQALGEGTGIPAAVGAILMLEGKVKGPGVIPPEAGVNPMDLLAIIPRVMPMDEKKEGGKKFGGVIVEEVDENGKVKKIDL